MSVSLEELNIAAVKIRDEFSQPIDSELLRNRLNERFPEAKSSQIELILTSFASISDPSANMIKSQDGEQIGNWYEFNPEKHHNFRIYSQEVLDLPTKSKTTISASSFKLVNLLPNPNNADFEPVSGLVIGNVQSGKTANFTALVSRAADSGYNLIIVLSGGNFNDLRVQTQSRLFKDLVDPVNNYADSKKWHKATTFDSENKGDVGDNNWDGDWNFETENCLIVSKKNADILPRIKTWLETKILPKAKSANIDINLLFIDDEADHASMNLELSNKNSKDEASKINKSIRKILHTSTRHAYIGFTASPFANMFVPPNFDSLKNDDGISIPTLYPRDFVFLLPEPDGYFGLKKLCPGDESEWTNHLSEVSEDEADFYRKNTEKRGLKESMFDGMRHSIFHFFASLGVRIIRKDTLNFHHSMLVHTKETKKTMHGLLDTIQPFVERLRQTIYARGRLRDSYKLTYSNFKKFYNDRIKNQITNPPSFEELIEVLNKYLCDSECSTFPHVLEISSDPERGDNLVYAENQPYSVIAIGGNRLARGFTLEGLYTSYFVREPKELKSDTLLQQGRWYGFRGKDEDLVRIFTTESLRNELWDLKRVEADLHDTIRHFEICKLDTRIYAIPVMKAANQIPTSKDKLPIISKVIHHTLPGDYLPKRGSGFPINITNLKKTEHEKKNQNNLDNCGLLIDKMVDLNGMPKRRKDGNYLFSDIPLDLVMDYFESTLEYFIDDPYNKDNLLDYLQTRKDNGQECSLWTVAIIGNKSNPKQDQTIRFGFSSNEFELNLVSRTRISKGTDDFRAFTQTAHFSLGIDNPQGATIKQYCGERDSKNPILIIYLIDKNSKPLKSHRAALNTKENILALAIGLPLATLTQEEKSKLNIEKWHNPQLEREVQ